MSFPKRTRLLAATVVTATALTLVPQQAANAEPAPVTGVELGTTVSNSVAVNARFDFNDAYSIGLPELKKLRGEMWDKNVPFDGTSIRKAAAAVGLPTKNDYVNAVSIDPILTRIAVQRAAEQHAVSDPYKRLSHDRVAAGDTFTASVDGKRSWGENLVSGNLANAISYSWGHNELPVLQQTNGYYGWVGQKTNGHLHMLLAPKNRYFGFAHVNVYAGGRYYDFSSAQVSETPLGGAALPAGKQELNLYRPARSGETPTGEQPFSAPAKPSPGNTGNANTSGSSASDVQTIISIISAVITLISVLTGLAQQFMR